MAERYCNQINCQSTQINSNVLQHFSNNKNQKESISNFNDSLTSVITINNNLSSQIKQQISPYQLNSLPLINENQNYNFLQNQTFPNVLTENQYQYMPKMSSIQSYSETPTTSTSPNPPTKSSYNIKLNNNLSQNNSLNYYQKNRDKNLIIKTPQTGTTENNNSIAFKVFYNHEKEKKKMLVFSILLITNLMIIVCLLFIWNIKGVNNENVTWAILALCGTTAFSIFCCVLYSFMFSDKWSNFNSLKSSNQEYKKKSQNRKFFMRFTKWKKRNENSSKIYSIQTVFPTPEIQYFSNPTVRKPMENPTFKQMISASNDSQLSSGAFSVASTQPISSMLNITQNLNSDNKLKNYDNVYATIPIHKNELENNGEINKPHSAQQPLYNSSQIHEIETLVAEGPQFKNYQPMEVIDLEPNIFCSTNIQNNINLSKQKYVTPFSNPII